MIERTTSASRLRSVFMVFPLLKSADVEATSQQLLLVLRGQQAKHTQKQLPLQFLIFEDFLKKTKLK